MLLTLHAILLPLRGRTKNFGTGSCIYLNSRRCNKLRSVDWVGCRPFTLGMAGFGLATLTQSVVVVLKRTQNAQRGTSRLQAQAMGPCGLPGSLTPKPKVVSLGSGG